MIEIITPTLEFEWDSEKNNTNEVKHGIRFEDIVSVFNDINRIELYDEEHSQNEDRYIVIGHVRHVIVVVYTIREPVIRIISARIATKAEEEAYYEGRI